MKERSPLHRFAAFAAGDLKVRGSTAFLLILELEPDRVGLTEAKKVPAMIINRLYGPCCAALATKAISKG